MSERLDLDHNAGGRPRPEVVAALAEWLREDAANPSSVHAAGRRARDAVEDARASVARLVGAEADEVIFTSGGTEANDLALGGILRAGDHVVASAIEHASVLRTLEDLAERRRLTVTWLRPDTQGRIAPADVAAALRPDTRVLTVGWANGELGTVQDVAALSARARQHAPAVLVHSDAVQAVGLLPVDVRAAGVALLSLSGHKIGALPGVGALVVERGVAIEPRLRGGAQERERRAGTENVPGIVSFGVAATLALAARAADAQRAARVKARLWGTLLEAAPVERLGSEDGLPSTLAVSFPGLRGDALVLALDLAGVAASAGSACAAGAAEPSPVLRAIGCETALARGMIRLSFGPSFGEDEAERAGRRVVDVVRRARRALERGAPSRAA
jgi:cysteine desulfurase